VSWEASEFSTLGGGWRILNGRERRSERNKLQLDWSNQSSSRQKQQ